MATLSLCGRHQSCRSLAIAIRWWAAWSGSSGFQMVDVDVDGDLASWWTGGVPRWHLVSFEVNCWERATEAAVPRFWLWPGFVSTLKVNLVIMIVAAGVFGFPQFSVLDRSRDLNG